MENNFSSSSPIPPEGPSPEPPESGREADRLAILEALSRTLVHEIRNHLSTVRMSLYILETSGGGTQDGEHFRIAREGILRIEGILRSLVTLTRPPDLRLSPADVVAAVQTGLEEAKDALLRNSVSVFHQYPESHPIVVMDPGQFSRAVAHVARNAAEAAAPGGELHVVVKSKREEDREWWVVELRDDGPGVPPDLGERVFEPCFTTREHRMGLGLTAARRLMESMGGRVTLDSEPGRGTVVTLLVPDRPVEAGR